MFNIKDYDYELPEAMIAQFPAPGRDTSRLLFAERSKRSLTDHVFSELPRLLRPGDLLVANNTRVVSARLFGRKGSGGRIEILVLEHPVHDELTSSTRWCLLRSSKRPTKGSRLFFECGVTGLVEDLGENGLTRITFQGTQSVDNLIEEKGCMPLPPYIKRDKRNGSSPLDRDRYQTVFSKEKGAVAAPTAGLHFTRELVETLNRAGISLVELTLHVGHGTFQPVRAKDIRNHHLGAEDFLIDPQTAEAINRCKREGRRVIAVGTTVVRTLESVAGIKGEIAPGKGKTDLLITPGFEFKVIDGLITNFHLPRSSLLFLVSAFAGLEFVREAYRRAMEKAYRFYSYGDAMLIL
ncbi:MAG: tRNA preQ1(34) S-adenosylmethionine ribosyltransferase-isomerase QueA [Desulfobacterales bacterium]|nr:tRNA preQ1(34) S-adenosylmethionine ribosyltransferase-isomerase QueA [Desulfobacterales bacterium]